MPRPYPVELRERVVAAYEDGEGSYEEVATIYRVGRASVDRWMAQRRRTGSLIPVGHGGGQPAKVDDRGCAALKAWLKDQPDLTLFELMAKYLDAFSVTVSKSAMSRALQRLGLTRKKRVSMRRSVKRPG